MQRIIPILGMLAIAGLCLQPALEAQGPIVEAQPSQGLEIGREDPALSALASAVMAEVVAIRGLPFTGPVRARYADKETLLGYLRSSEEKLLGKERKQWDQWVAQLLGLIDADTDLQAIAEAVLTSQVGGFYDPESKIFFVMDGLPEGLIRILMAHELAHALDDQHFDLLATDRARKDQTDGLYAHHAVAEGSAQVIMGRWLSKNLKTLDHEALAAFQDQMDLKLLSRAPRLVWQPLFALYTQGQAFLARKETPNPFAQASLEDLSTAFQQLPVSTEQILHPAKYWDPAKRDLPILVEHTFAAEAMGGWERLFEDVLGELVLTLLLESRTLELSPVRLMGMKFALPEADGWGGDRLSLFRREAALLVVLDVVWDTEKDASEFASALSKRPGDVSGYEWTLQRSAPDQVRYLGFVGVSREAALELAASVQVKRSPSGKIPAPQTLDGSGVPPESSGR